MRSSTTVIRPARPWLAAALVLFFGLTILPAWGLEFANFVARGYEGKGELEFIMPEDLLLGPSGEIIVADQKNNRIQILTPEGLFKRFLTITPKTPGVASYLADLTATQTASLFPPEKKRESSSSKAQKQPEPPAPPGPRLDKPVGLALDGKGHLFVAGSGTGHIWVLRLSDGALLGVIGRFGRLQGQFDTPLDIDVRADGWLAVADSGNRRVQIFDANRKFVREIHYKEETKKKELRSLAPRGVCWLPTGHLAVSYPSFHQIVCWNTNGAVVWRYGAQGNAKGELNEPSYIVPGPSNHLFIADSRNHRFVEITNNGMYVKNYPVGRGSAPGRLFWPRGMALTSEDTLIISDQGNSRVQFFQPSRAAMILREAKTLANRDQWDEAYVRIEQVLNLQPNDPDARALMVNALHFFGDRAMNKGNFEQAEEFLRRILIYSPSDPNVQKKLDTIFWASNKDLIGNFVFGIIAVIAALILFWIVKTTLSRLIFGHP
ncbi:MAG TPA: tetratricopeptide repeat protein [Candidatus Ozemobacteraceae bacterium]|nr:tetratricopeptide repeat protein [Candidatus Ozemobacteraceae bacterium]